MQPTTARLSSSRKVLRLDPLYIVIVLISWHTSLCTKRGPLWRLPWQGSVEAGAGSPTTAAASGSTSKSAVVGAGLATVLVILQKVVEHVGGSAAGAQETLVSMSLVQEGPTLRIPWPFKLTSRETSATPYISKENSIQVSRIWPLASGVLG
jgi:hypothetical protein